MALVSLLQDISSPAAQVVLKQDECSNNRGQTVLLGGGMREPRPLSCSWDTLVSPQSLRSPEQGVWLVWMGGKGPTSFPLAFCH